MFICIDVVAIAGDCFLELVSPLGPIEKSAGGRYWQRFSDGGYMVRWPCYFRWSPHRARGKDRQVLMQVNDLSRCEAVWLEQGVRPIYGLHREPGNGTHPYPGGRRQPGTGAIPATDGITATHFHPKDMGCIFSADQSVPKEEWLWAGASWRKVAIRSEHGIPSRRYSQLHGQESDFTLSLLLARRVPSAVPRSAVASQE